MRKTTLRVDEELFRLVREVLGTRDLTATVQLAFEMVLTLDARHPSIRQLQRMDGLELDKPKVLDDAWR